MTTHKAYRPQAPLRAHAITCTWSQRSSLACARRGAWGRGYMNEKLWWSYVYSLELANNIGVCVCKTTDNSPRSRLENFPHDTIGCLQHQGECDQTRRSRGIEQFYRMDIRNELVWLSTYVPSIAVVYLERHDSKPGPINRHHDVALASYCGNVATLQTVTAVWWRVTAETLCFLAYYGHRINRVFQALKDEDIVQYPLYI